MAAKSPPLDELDRGEFFCCQNGISRVVRCPSVELLKTSVFVSVVLVACVPKASDSIPCLFGPSYKTMHRPRQQSTMQPQRKPCAGPLSVANIFRSIMRYRDGPLTFFDAIGSQISTRWPDCQTCVRLLLCTEMVLCHSSQSLYPAWSRVFSCRYTRCYGDVCACSKAKML